MRRRKNGKDSEKGKQRLKERERVRERDRREREKSIWEEEKMGKIVRKGNREWKRESARERCEREKVYEK